MLLASTQTAPPVPPVRKRFTRKEYYFIFDSGLFGEERYELIDGDIIQMQAMASPHAVAIELCHDALKARFGKGFSIRVQVPLIINEFNEPMPDVAVVRGTARDYLKEHPRTAMLVVEVADSSLNYDRSVKAGLYAQAGVTEYWILNLVNRRLEVYREPTAMPDTPQGYGYALLQIVQAGESIATLERPDSAIKLEDLLPWQPGEGNSTP